MPNFNFFFHSQRKGAQQDVFPSVFIFKMSQIHNSDLFKEFRDAAKSQGYDIPTSTADKIVPVMEVNPKLLRRINIIKAVDVAGTVYTTPANTDFFLVGTHISGVNNVASQVMTLLLTVTEKNGTATVLNTAFGATSAILDVTAAVSNQTFSLPIQLARGSNITFGATNAAGRRAVIVGYLVENINA